MKRNILLNPGPVTTTNTVKEALLVPDICHREKEFSSILPVLCKKLASVVRGDVVVLFAGSGTAAVEAMINSSVADGSKLAILQTGVYANRMMQMAKGYRIPVVPINQISEIEKDPAIQAVAMVHHETSTGRIYPIEEIGPVVKKLGKTFIVDAMSSYAGLPIDVKASCIDFLASSANKCMQGLPGASFVICNKEALEKTKGIARSHYLDLFDEYQYFQKAQEMRFTAPVQIMYALRQAVEELFQEGLEGRFRRYKNNSDALKKGILDLGLHIENVDVKPYPLLFSIQCPKDFDFQKIHDQMYAQGFTIYPGSTTTFRLACIGDLTTKDIEAFCSAFKAVYDPAAQA